MTQDRIEREVTVAAPIETVWAVLTESEHVGAWFGGGPPADIDLRVGGVMVLNHGDHGTYPTLIVKVDPPHAFSYRWASGYPGVVATEDNATLVEFTLEELGDKTLVKLVESGFATVAVPSDREVSAGFDSHAKGWTEVVGNFGRYAEAQLSASSDASA
jgi:uncharacterized protein YndB with AHSA1/START domain